MIFPFKMAQINSPHFFNRKGTNTYNIRKRDGPGGKVTGNQGLFN